MTFISQATLAGPVSATGYGLHTGHLARVTVHPAPIDHGIRFRVTVDGEPVDVAPDWRTRTASRLNTALALPDGGKLRMIEHIMSSCMAFGIDNALIAVDGREIPIFDGSAATWCRLFAGVGTLNQDAPRRCIRVTKPIQVSHFAGFIRLEPHDGFFLDVTYDRLPAFGVLAWSGEVTRDSFIRELSRSRSPGRLSQLLKHVWPDWTADIIGRAEARWRDRGDAIAGAPANLPRADLACGMSDVVRTSLAPSGSEPVLRGLRPGRVAMMVGRYTLGGRRYPGEAARHAALDLIGDLGLVGGPLRARVVAHSPTHALTYAMAATLRQNPGSWTA